jgi:phosphoribosylformimino-5-aminoimidazole carboxamide ribonucleotide (ProFAR) isomerase
MGIVLRGCNKTHQVSRNILPLTESLKRTVGIPVILTGGIKDANVADQLPQGGKAVIKLSLRSPYFSPSVI